MLIPYRHGGELHHPIHTKSITMAVFTRSHESDDPKASLYLDPQCIIQQLGLVPHIDLQSRSHLFLQDAPLLAQTDQSEPCQILTTAALDCGCLAPA